MANRIVKRLKRRVKRDAEVNKATVGMLAKIAGKVKRAKQRVKKPVRSGETSARIASQAAKLFAMSDYNLDVWINADPKRARNVLRSLCGSLINQAPDRIDLSLLPKRVQNKLRGIPVRYDVYSIKTRKGESGLGRIRKSCR